MRSFIAFELTEPIRDSLRALQSELRRKCGDVRWVRVESMHLTLRFLGEIDPDIAPRIGEAMEEAVSGEEPFDLRLSGLGVFPNLSRPRVVWVGVAGDVDPLQRIKGRLDDGLGSIGFQRENRPFKPHITLGRAKGRIDGRVLIDRTEFSTDNFLANRIYLIRSILKPEGAEYSEILSRPLAAGISKGE